MADENEEVIEEPFIEASHYSFYPPNSELMQYYYRLKYPHIYSLPPCTILKLLDSKEIYSDLENSVKSFVDHVSQSYKANKALSTAIRSKEMEREKLPIYDSTWSTCTFNTSYEKAANIVKMSILPTDLSLYDSVHSIKVPLRTYQNKSRQKINFKKPDESSNSCPSVAEVTQQMNGLVFERVEKSITLPVGHKNLTHHRRKHRHTSVTPYSRKRRLEIQQPQ